MKLYKLTDKDGYTRRSQTNETLWGGEWSWPGYKIDRTAVGVVAHEVGHHVEVTYIRRLSKWKELGAAWREGLVKHKRERVSGYEPVPSEAWAETMRLFILNPDLLRRACPWRCAFIYDDLGLRPASALAKTEWRETLGNKHYEQAAERWIAHAK